jgi:hypothetical protein
VVRRFLYLLLAGQCHDLRQLDEGLDKQGQFQYSCEHDQHHIVHRVSRTLYLVYRSWSVLTASVVSVVKEGGLLVLGQVLINVAIGTLIANIVCFVLWPQSATVNLQRDMITSLESYATLLDMLSSSFLLDPRSKGRHHLIRAVEAHQAGFTSLKRNLDEAKSEWILDPPDAPSSSRGFRQKSLSFLYGEAVDCLNRLAQHLAGLRSGTKLQRDLTLVYGRRKAKEKVRDEIRKAAGGNGEAGALPQVQDPKEVDEEEAALSAAALAFGSLVEDVGPPMVTLTVRARSHWRLMHC